MSHKITVVMKDSERTLKQDFLYYETDGAISLSRGCSKLKAMVDEAVANFNHVPETIMVKMTYVWEA